MENSARSERFLQRGKDSLCRIAIDLPCKVLRTDNPQHLRPQRTCTKRAHHCNNAFFRHDFLHHLPEFECEQLLRHPASREAVVYDNIELFSLVRLVLLL